jgi:hypothetical protein
MQKLVTRRRFPDLAGPGGVKGAPQGMGAKGPENDSGRPEEPGPDECAARMHGPDRCKIRRGTKAQNEG